MKLSEMQKEGNGRISFNTENIAEMNIFQYIFCSYWYWGRIQKGFKRLGRYLIDILTTVGLFLFEFLQLLGFFIIILMYPLYLFYYSWKMIKHSREKIKEEEASF